MKRKKNPHQTISQFAELCGTTRQTLQYYDKIGLLHPLYIGEQGYRYYDPVQRYDFQLISTLKQSGCSLDEINEIMKRNGDEQVLQILADKRQQLTKEAKKVAMFRTFLDYTISFLKLLYSSVSEKPRLIELNHFVGIIRFALKKPMSLYSEELAEGILEFNYFCSTNENIQQYPYGYVIPQEEFDSGLRRATHIICMCHGSDPNDIPTLIPQGKYILLKKRMHVNYEADREEAYSLLYKFMAENNLKPNGDAYEVPADIPEFMRKADHYHVIIMVSVTEENN